jgi:HEPN domain-containing protein
VLKFPVEGKFMGNSTRVEIQPGELLITPAGLHYYAKEFLRAAEEYKIESGYSPVGYYLCSHALELVLKAFLRAKNIPTRDLIDTFRHNLEKILAKARNMGIETLVSITPKQELEILKANKYYSKKGFEYFKIGDAITGYSKLPDLKTLKETTGLLIEKLYSLCRNPE